ncbi:MAG: type II toxin-antitoxin system VapC family toxin [Parvibaculum sp.]|uniref:PIN domain-containing protein n=1 Tax=Parvibaculum sp. TaxID=2024848 RepID=UPI002ABACF3A|nr:type II toxin-antitoxin system VapC family toxin [Parvibaculum sp.]MDZ4382244.1 type II toxin-antitoxin system VapC family toxin [Parvibaculum sp.]
MIGLDTNILLRWLLDDSIVADDAPAQTELVSRTILESGETFFVNDIVLAETIWVLRNKVGQSRKVVEEIVNRLLCSVNVETANPAVIRRALDAFVKGKADFADYLIAELNAEAGCSTTLTFDGKASRHPSFSRLGK